MVKSNGRVRSRYVNFNLMVRVLMRVLRAQFKVPIDQFPVLGAFLGQGGFNHVLFRFIMLKRIKPDRLSREVGNKPHMRRQQMGRYEAGMPRQASFRSSLLELLHLNLATKHHT